MNFEGIELRPVKLRQSCAKCAYACERKWFLKYRLGVTLRGGEFKEAAKLGQIYHKFMQWGLEREEDVRAWVRKQQVELAKTIEAGGDMDGSLARRVNKLTDLFNIARVMATIFEEKFPQPEWFQTIGREITNECMYEGVLLSGTIDKLLLDTRTGNVWVRDYKSTGRGLEAIFSGASWGLQGRIYRLLADDWLRNAFSVSKAALDACPEPVKMQTSGFILDGIKRPGIKLCKTDQANAKKWNCTVEEAYLRRVKEWYKLEEGKKDAKVMRSKAILYTEERMTSELAMVFRRFTEYSSFDNPKLGVNAADPDLYPRDLTGNSCMLYERQCQFHDLCETDPKQWDRLFDTKYEIIPEEETEEHED